MFVWLLEITTEPVNLCWLKLAVEPKVLLPVSSDILLPVKLNPSYAITPSTAKLPSICASLVTFKFEDVISLALIKEAVNSPVIILLLALIIDAVKFLNSTSSVLVN